MKVVGRKIPVTYERNLRIRRKFKRICEMGRLKKKERDDRKFPKESMKGEDRSQVTTTNGKHALQHRSVFKEIVWKFRQKIAFQRPAMSNINT